MGCGGIGLRRLLRRKVLLCSEVGVVVVVVATRDLTCVMWDWFRRLAGLGWDGTGWRASSWQTVIIDHWGFDGLH
jgi:hypothetical protein